MRMTFELCLALVPLLAFAGIPNNSDEDAIHSLVDRLMAAWNHHDAHAFAAVFAEDADFTNVIGEGASGRENIEKLHAPMFSTLFKNSHLEYTDIKVRFIRPDISPVDVRWRMTGATDPAGNPWPNRKGLINFVATKENGSWQVLVLHNMELTDEGK
jgi:uncharacterized protein (TIGR02246 family)